MIISNILNILENIWYDTQTDGTAIHTQLNPSKNQLFTKNPTDKVISAAAITLNKILLIILISFKYNYIMQFDKKGKSTAKDNKRLICDMCNNI